MAQVGRILSERENALWRTWARRPLPVFLGTLAQLECARAKMLRMGLRAGSVYLGTARADRPSVHIERALTLLYVALRAYEQPAIFEDPRFYHLDVLLTSGKDFKRRFRALQGRGPVPEVSVGE